MNNDEKIAKEIAMYRELADQDKNIDVAGLMVRALEKGKENTLSSKQKTRAYLVSLVLPPFGLFYALKFYFSGTEDGKEAALMCTALTAITILTTLVMFKIMLSGAGVNVNQIEQIKPQDIQQLVQ